MNRQEKMSALLKLFDEYLIRTSEIIKTIHDEYKEPCKHEPKDHDIEFNIEFIRGKEFVSLNTLRDFAEIATVYNLKCKHCGIKIKAEKWVEA